jgi:hypothetical protein
MLARSELNHILGDEALTRHLGDAEARILVEWLVEQAERLGERLPAGEVGGEVRRLRRRGRALARFVRLWCFDNLPGAAAQLAASEQFHWPLPDGPIEPALLMQHAVDWETHYRRKAEAEARKQAA